MSVDYLSKKIKKYFDEKNESQRIPNEVFDNSYICMNDDIRKSEEVIPDDLLDKIQTNKLVISCSPITRVDNLPPNKIKYLWLVAYFNQSVANLPIGIEELYLGDYFNQSVDFIPISVKLLSLGIEFNQPLDNLPPGLEILEFNSIEYTHSLSSIPASCKTFILHGLCTRHLNDLPDTVETIIIHNQSNWTWDNSEDFKQPTGLKKMVIFIYYGWLEQVEIIRKKVSPDIIDIRIVRPS